MDARNPLRRYAAGMMSAVLRPDAKNCGGTQRKRALGMYAQGSFANRSKFTRASEMTTVPGRTKPAA